jgi:regulator of nonsense transcripts 2
VSGPRTERNDDSESEEEQIFVTRQEEERDPEAEAEFDREFEKMMAESVESRKFERKHVFDLPLPMKRSARETTVEAPPVPQAPQAQVQPQAQAQPQPSGNTMAFSLMTKRGNKQQTRTIDLPSDSTFAVAMRSQQQADREEQQRIKNLVLNYEMSNEVEPTEGKWLVLIHGLILTCLDVEKRSPHRDSRMDKSGANRSAFRSRKLQLSDVNW